MLYIFGDIGNYIAKEMAKVSTELAIFDMFQGIVYCNSEYLPENY